MGTENSLGIKAAQRFGLCFQICVFLKTVLCYDSETWSSESWKKHLDNLAKFWIKWLVKALWEHRQAQFFLLWSREWRRQLRRLLGEPTKGVSAVSWNTSRETSASLHVRKFLEGKTSPNQEKMSQRMKWIGNTGNVSMVWNKRYSFL